jgi:hypothetical protein
MIACRKLMLTRSFSFQANQFQLQGPPPPELYHRYVEFKSFVKGMFTSSGIRGFLLSKALHHQHNQVYNYGRTTEYGSFDGPSKEATMKFLDLVHYDQGGRIFTYVLTLDSLFRFTETGKEFGIDFLSKHTMHSNVSAYIAYSGEFFVRRLKHKNRLAPEEGGEHNESHPPQDIDGGAPSGDPPNDPGYFELVIDNDSGTYRPNAALLPKLKEFLRHSLPGLHIITLDCQKDAERQQRMKKEQRDLKEKEGDRIIYRQMSRGSSVSSSDISELDAMEAGNGGNGEHGILGSVKRNVSTKAKQRQQHWKGLAKGRNVDDGLNITSEEKLTAEPGVIHESAEASKAKGAPAFGEESKTNGHSNVAEESKTNGHSTLEDASKTNGESPAHPIAT